MADRIPPTDQPFTVPVKGKHFKGAVRASPTQCLLVQAVRAAFPDLDGLDIVEVHSTDMVVRYYDKEIAGPHPEKTFLWRHDGKHLVRRFDRETLYADDLPEGGATVVFTPVGRTHTIKG